MDRATAQAHLHANDHPGWTHLLDVLQNFMLFMQAGGQTIKTVCRYQQYRAVNRAMGLLWQYLKQTVDERVNE